MTNDLQGIYGNYFAMNGGSVLPAPFTTSSTIDGPQNRQTSAFRITTLQKAHVIVPAGQTGPNGAGDNSETLLSAGRTAAFESGDRQTNSLSQLSSFKTGVMPLPIGSQGPKAPRPQGPKGRISVFNGLTDGIADNTRYPQQSWELVRWLASAQSQQILGSGGYVRPAIRSLDPLFLTYRNGRSVDTSPFPAEATGQTVNFPVATGVAEAHPNVTTQRGPTFLGTAPVAVRLASAKQILDYRISDFH